MSIQMRLQITFDSLSDDVYDVQSVEVKPLAFGLKFVQVHVVMNDGPGLTDAFEENVSKRWRWRN